MPRSLEIDFQQPGILRRLAAILYDTILIIALLMIITFFWLVCLEILNKHFSFELKSLTTTGLQIICVFLIVLFFIFFWKRNGQTLGMMTWRIRLRTLDNSELSVRALFIRLCAATFSIACLGLGYLWMLIDKNNLTWHDRISNTGLEYVPKNKSD